MMVLLYKKSQQPHQLFAFQHNLAEMWGNFAKAAEDFRLQTTTEEVARATLAGKHPQTATQTDGVQF